MKQMNDKRHLAPAEFDAELGALLDAKLAQDMAHFASAAQHAEAEPKKRSFNKGDDK